MKMPDEWWLLTASERAEWLLDNNIITAKMQIMDDVEHVYLAYAGNIQLSGAGEFETETAATLGGENWLKSIAGRL